MEAPERLNNVVDYIIANHDRKTHDKTFNAMFCIHRKETLLKYYELFKQKRLAGEHNLKVATIFSYNSNEADQDVDDITDTDSMPEEGEPINLHSRDALEACIQDFNADFGTNHSTKDSKRFYQYYQDIGKYVREGKIDILLVVNMFLTGFDSKTLNTMYVDKNLKYHGLIQAYSRTNRIYKSKKSQGNIVCFRNLKKTH